MQWLIRFSRVAFVPGRYGDLRVAFTSCCFQEGTLCVFHEGRTLRKLKWLLPRFIFYVPAVHDCLRSLSNSRAFRYLRPLVPLWRVIS